MSETRNTRATHIETYKIIVIGLLDAHWNNRFDGMTLTPDKNEGTTTLSGKVVDQAALYGILRKIRDAGIQLHSVIRVETDEASSPADNE